MVFCSELIDFVMDTQLIYIIILIRLGIRQRREGGGVSLRVESNAILNWSRTHRAHAFQL